MKLQQSPSIKCEKMSLLACLEKKNISFISTYRQWCMIGHIFNIGSFDRNILAMILKGEVCKKIV